MWQIDGNLFKNQGPVRKIFRGKGQRCRCFLVLLLAVLMIAGSAPPGYAASTPRRAVIASMEGSVLIQAAGQAATVPARKGMELKSGDRIITGKDGTAEIRYDDGSISRISPDSRIDLKDLSRESKDSSETTVMENKWGKVWNNAKGAAQKNSRFQVNTPSAVASVRGTNFMVGVGEDRGTTVRVYDGTVGVGADGGTGSGGGGGSGAGAGAGGSGNGGGETMVGAFQQLDVGAGGAPAADPGSLDYLDIDDWEKDNLVEDNPGAYIDVETEIKTRQLENAEERLLEALKDLAALNKELELIARKLAAETDPAKLAQLQSLQQQLQKEQGSRQEIIKNIEKERESLTEEKKRFTELKEKKAELTPEKLKEEARGAREEDKSRAAEREKQAQQRAEQQKAAEGARAQAGKAAEDLGLGQEMQQAAGSVTNQDIQDLAKDMQVETPGRQPGDGPATPPTGGGGTSEDTAANIKYALTLIGENIASTPAAGNLAAGTTVTVTVTPAEGQRVAIFSVGGIDKRTELLTLEDKYTYTFDMPAANTEVAVTYEDVTVTTYSLVLQASPTGGGTALIDGAETSNGSYAAGATILLAATPSDGYEFVSWTSSFGDNDSSSNPVVSTSATFTYTMPAMDITLTANFRVIAIEEGTFGLFKDVNDIKARWSGFDYDYYGFKIIDLNEDPVMSCVINEKGMNESYDLAIYLPRLESGTATYSFELYSCEQVESGGFKWGEKIATLENAIVVTVEGDPVSYDMAFNDPDGGIHTITWGSAGEPDGVYHIYYWYFVGSDRVCFGGGGISPHLTKDQTVQDGDSFDLRILTAYDLDGQTIKATMTPESLKTFACLETTGTLQGYIKDSVSNDTLSGVCIILSRDGERIGDPQITNERGEYCFENLWPGFYDLELSLDGYIAEIINGVGVFSNNTTHRDIPLTAILVAEEVRIVLTWGETPSDLDAYLIIDRPADLGGTCEVYWGNGQFYHGGTLYAELDIDDRDGYGPETLTIYEPIPWHCTYKVHNFAHEYCGEIPLKDSRAEVKVYQGAYLKEFYTIPSDLPENEYWWDVFNIP